MEHHEKYPTQKKYEYYIGDRKLEGNFKVVGQFENLTFIEHNLNVNYREFRKISIGEGRRLESISYMVGKT